MSMIHPRSLVAAILALVIAGCQEAPTSPTADDVAPSFNFVNGPEAPGNGNSAVLRLGASFDFLTFEETGTDDLLAYHIQANDIFFCGGTGAYPVLDIQAVQTPSGMMRGIVHLDDAPVAIYRPADFFAAFFAGFDEWCEFMTNEWLYVGSHRLRIVGQLGVGPTFGWTANGDVTDQSGASFRYAERVTFVVTDQGPEQKVFEIDVRPKGRN
jgi:hypothetical protein